MSLRINYRTPKPGEEEAISECLLAAATLDEMTDGTPESIEEWLEICSPGEIRSRISSGDMSLVATSGDEILGYIAFRRATHLSLLFVRKSVAGTGIGRELFRRCADGLPIITVNSSDGAVGFYKKMGFVKNGERHWSKGAMVTPMKWANPSL